MSGVLSGKRSLDDDDAFTGSNKRINQQGNVVVYPTTDESLVGSLEKWFQDNQFKGLEYLDFKLSSKCNNSLGCFAKKAFAVNDVLFSVPQTHIMGISQVLSTPLSKYIIQQSSSYKLQDVCTLEFLFWIHMIAEKAHNMDNIYIHSLSKTSPFIYQWDPALLQLIEQTNLFKSLQNMNERIQQYLTFFQYLYQEHPVQANELLPPQHFHTDAFYWAIGHYLSRRYPGQYATQDPVHDTKTFKQEENLGNIGSLVPLLDILNHQDDQEYLRFEVNSNGYLNVLCNYPVKEGEELFSNYGALSNEQLLFAYGYALLDNKHDSFPMKLRIPSTVFANGNVFALHTGGWDGIPKDLLRALQLLRTGKLPSKASIEMKNEVDPEDCEIVMNYVMDYLLNMKSMHNKREQTLKKYGIEWIVQYPEETAEGDVLIDYESFQPMTSIELKSPGQSDISSSQRDQAAFLTYYLMGQYRIVVAIAQDLQHILISAEEDGDEEGVLLAEGDEDSSDESSDDDHI